MPEERRRFFRIDDEIAIRLHKMNENAVDAQQEFRISLDVQIRQAMVGVRAQYPKLATLLELMNQNINLLHAKDNPNEEILALRKANLSACGVAFSWSENLLIGQLVMVSMYLQPSYEQVNSKAHVTAVDPNPDYPDTSNESYIVRLDFDDIESGYQEALIQHIVQRQSYQLRQRMDTEEDD